MSKSLRELAEEALEAEVWSANHGNDEPMNLKARTALFAAIDKAQMLMDQWNAVVEAEPALADDPKTVMKQIWDKARELNEEYRAEGLAAFDVSKPVPLTRADVEAAQVAALLSVHPATVREWLKSGELSAKKLGRRWYVSRAGLRRRLGEARDDEQARDAG